MTYIILDRSLISRFSETKRNFSIISYPLALTPKRSVELMRAKASDYGVRIAAVHPLSELFPDADEGFILLVGPNGEAPSTLFPLRVVLLASPGGATLLAPSPTALAVDSAMDESAIKAAQAFEEPFHTTCYETSLGLASVAEIDALLERTKTVAVVGLSDDPNRQSRDVASYLHAEGYRVVGVNPRLAGERLFGETVVGSLSEAADADVADVFRKPDAVPTLAKEALSLGVGAFWMQLGVVSESAARKLASSSVTVVMDRCMAVEHKRWTSR